ncbi:MAG: allantoinase PuuE [Pseudomonadota bacterium]
MSTNEYPRDLIGYGDKPPHAQWPDQARIAVQFVLNYEEGGENSILHGDGGAETFLSEIVSAPVVENARHMSMESIYEYGSRVGVWRILSLFERFDIPITIFAVASALERYPQMADVFQSFGHEICSHGYRWIDYQWIPEDIEREHIEKAIDVFVSLTGKKPLGWYTGRTSPNTRRLVAGYDFLYDADDYNDELPYWTTVGSKNHLVVPYTLDANDMRFATPQGFNCGDQFYRYLVDTFDVLYAEGEQTPRMMSVGLHCRLIGRPGRFAALARFVEYAKQHAKVWFCRRDQIAQHWHKHHAPGRDDANQ